MHVIRGLIAVSITLVLGGCLGAGASFSWHTVRNDGNQVRELRQSFGPLDQVVTKEMVLQHIVPDRVVREGNLERMITYGGGDWRGMVLWASAVVPVPIPFLMYFGSEYVEYTFRDNILIEVRDSGSHITSACFCGLFYDVKILGDSSIAPACGCGEGKYPW
jgi:hypothetical protein